ncbi:MAG: hypothetical protein U9N30_09400, partial [Campylobacterota bacterium]|nr:hypothetical protein [Campylobacterota bacterium]
PNIEKNDIFISKKQSKRENKNYDAVWNAGFYLYGWDYEWEFDYRKKRPKISADQIVKRIERLYKKNKIAKQDKFILLLHDPMFKNKYNGRKILQQLIQKLKSNGWEFDSIANYLTSDDFLYAKYHQNYDGSTATVMANNMQTLPSTPIKAKKIAQAPKIAKYDTKIKIQKKKKKKIVKKPSSVKKQHHVKNTIKAIHNDPKKTMEMQLFEAISRVDVHHVRNLIQSGVNIHAYNRYGQSAIVLATTLKQSNIVQVLIQNGANINHKDQNGNSALMVLQSMTR